jgi:hypothetical protein
MDEVEAVKAPVHGLGGWYLQEICTCLGAAVSLEEGLLVMVHLSEGMMTVIPVARDDDGGGGLTFLQCDDVDDDERGPFSFQTTPPLCLRGSLDDMDSGQVAFATSWAPGHVLVTDASENSIHIVDVKTRKHAGYFVSPGKLAGPRCIVFCKQGPKVAVSAWTRTYKYMHQVFIFGPPQGQTSPLHEWVVYHIVGGLYDSNPRFRCVAHMAFSNDGQKLAVCSRGPDLITELSFPSTDTIGVGQRELSLHNAHKCIRGSHDGWLCFNYHTWLHPRNDRSLPYDFRRSRKDSPAWTVVHIDDPAVDTCFLIVDQKGSAQLMYFISSLRVAWLGTIVRALGTWNAPRRE